MTSHYVFTQSAHKDLEEISLLVNSAYRGESSRAGWTTEADYLEGQRTDPQLLTQNLNSSPHSVILCVREKIVTAPILGCVFLEPFEDKHGVCCYLGMLTVKPTLQAQGLGKILHEQAQNLAREWGALRMSITVIHLRFQLIAWYERLGYKNTGATKAFPYGNPKLGLPQRDDLHFVVYEKKL